jgi:23S rRNA (uracil747-C5)-methyltransferase
MDTIAKLIDTANLAPYQIETQRGELKGVTVLRNTTETAGILRFVLRSTEAIPRIRKKIPEILEQHPWVTVVSCNIQPIHAALPEGPEEVVLTYATTMAERYGDIQLHFSPQSFMQVTPAIARALYERARTYVRVNAVQSVLDLYCGVGGFLCSVGPEISHGVGVEITASAVEAARSTAREHGYTHLEFHARSVDDYLGSQHFPRSERSEQPRQPDLVLVNPPRRGLNTNIINQLLALNPEHILYSSCNPESFARDAAQLVHQYELVTVAPFDMFPLTAHCELLAAFRRRA